MCLVTGLGQIFKRRPKVTAEPPPKALAKPPLKDVWVLKDGHWRFCSAPYGRAVSCGLELKLKFRHSFEEFLREVEDAYGRWMERPTARMLIKKLQKDRKQWPQELLSAEALGNDPIVLVAGLLYRRSNGTWLVDRSELCQ